MITLETEKQFEELKMNKRYLNLQPDGVQIVK